MSVTVTDWIQAIASGISAIVAGVAYVISRRAVAIAEQQAAYARQQNEREDASRHARAVCLAAEILPDIADLQVKFTALVSFGKMRLNYVNYYPGLQPNYWHNVCINIPNTLMRPAVDFSDLGPDLALEVLEFRKLSRRNNNMTASLVDLTSVYRPQATDEFVDGYTPHAEHLGRSGLELLRKLTSLVESVRS